MTTPTRPKRQPAFSEKQRALEEAREKSDDALDSLPPVARAADRTATKRDTAPPMSSEGQHLQVVPPRRTPTQAQFDGAAAADEAPAKSVDGTRAAVARPAAHRTSPAVKSKSGRNGRRPNKPPEAAIPYAVYQRLRAISAEEKRLHRESVRPFGVIVMDALEKHAATLMNLWAAPEPASAPAAGSLFIRTAAISDSTPPRRRTGSMKTIALSGVSGANAALLDRYAHEWNAGSRAALVEEALRLEFGMPHSADDVIEGAAST